MTATARAIWFLGLASTLLLSVAATAHADAPPARSEAAESFDRALRLVNSGDLLGGLAEFDRAYALVPSPIVSYNLGLVYAALHRPVESARYLGVALAHRQSLKPEEVTHATSTLRDQQETIGQVTVSTNVKEGVVEVDNVEVAQLPLDRALDVASGPHVIGVVSPGHAPARREVIVAGRQQSSVALELVTIEGLLAHIAVRGSIPAADVFVDGERVGKTPLETTITVTPGTHGVEVRRAGYLTAARSISLKDGARAELTLDPTLDPSALGREGGWLAIETSETQSVVNVDGTDLGLLKSPLELPAGPHRIRVERGGFLPAERDVDVPRHATQSISVVFEPTPDTRAAYVSGAESHRTWSWVTIGAGTAIAAGGTILALVEQHKLPAARNKLAAVNADWMDQGGKCNLATGPSQDLRIECADRLNTAHAHVKNLETARTVGWGLAAGGGAILVTGVVLLLTGDDPHKYDEQPSERLLTGWQLQPGIGPASYGLTATHAFW